MPREKILSVTRADLEIQTFRAGGKGGQHQNKTESGVRIIHRASGAVGLARDGRSQHRNRKVAYRRLVDSPKFQLWIRRESAKRMVDQGKIKQKVDCMMNVANLKVEVMEDGEWVKI